MYISVLQEKLKTSVSKSLFSRPTDEEAHAEIKKLRTQLETLTNSSDDKKTLLKKQEEVNSLKEKIVQLESDKAAIFEASKMDLQSRVKDNKSKEEVTSQLESIALEEKVDIGLKEAVALRQQIHQLIAEKNDLKSKLDRFMAENMELLERIEKLSKGSSAESIEIVEGLTAEEKLEMEQFQKGLEMRQRRLQSSITEDDDTDYIPTIPAASIFDSSSASKDGDNNTSAAELNNGLDKLREERTELLQKIELFTAERHEVLEKMDVLKKENNKLVSITDELRVDKLESEQSCETLRKENLSTIKRLREVEDERQDLLDNIREMSDIKTRLQEEVNMLTKERNTTTENKQGDSFINRESYASSLKSLEAELEKYAKAKDKNAKFGISKKVAKEAKNVSDIMAQLLNDYERIVDSFNSLQAEVEGVRLAREEFDRCRVELMAEGCDNDTVAYIKTLKEKLERQVKSQRETRDRCEELEQIVEEERREKGNLKR